MDLNKFIADFQGQLEDLNTDLNENTNYVYSDFWDSLTAMVVKVMIEDEYGLDISVEKLESFQSINELYQYLISIKDE